MKKTKKPQLNIERKGASWGRLPGMERRLRQAFSLTLACLPTTLLPAARLAEATLLLTSDREVQSLNRDFRGKNAPTNVLSFPHFEKKALIRLGKGDAPLYVGDIAVAYAFTAREAKAEGKALPDHLTHLMIHGLLHLFGYDHDTPARAARMEKLEREVMASLGLPDPYAPLSNF